jgi:hypothetical protein
MENLELPEWLKIALGICGGAFAWGLVFWLLKEWIKDHVLEAIEDLKNKNIEMRNDFTRFSDRINSFLFKIINSQNDLSKSVTKEVTEMTRLFEKTQEKVTVLESVADKMVKITTVVSEKNRHLETEVKKISDELILIRDKK